MSISWLSGLAIATMVTTITIAACTPSDRRSQDSPANIGETEGAIAVDVGIARLGKLEAEREYIGTTLPRQSVSLRSQVEGQLNELFVDVGDRVLSGQLVGRLDDTLLVTEVNKARAELASLTSQLLSARGEVSNARTQLDRTLVELEQAENEVNRFQKLAQAGAIARRELESLQTAAKLARKAVLSAQERVQIQQQATVSVRGQIAAQEAVIAQQEQRQSYTRLVAPIPGIVIAKSSEPGSLIRSGEEVLQIADFSWIKIETPVSELDLAQIDRGQPVDIQLDAFPNQSFRGKVDKILPVANPNTRQFPVEVVLPNPEAKITSGLLARVKFPSAKQSEIIIPESALITEDASQQYYVFLVNNDSESSAIVNKRLVTIDRIVNKKVAITSGLQVGEKFVVQSNKPLQEGDLVKFSILSEL